MLDLAFTEIARYGRSSISVSCRILDAVRELSSCVRTVDDRRALERLAAFVGERAPGAFDHQRDREELAASYRHALAALHVDTNGEGERAAGAVGPGVSRTYGSGAQSTSL
jgi:uncharacterized membrane protein